MHRNCTNCHKPFSPQDLVRDTTKGMEADRKALGLDGVLFRYYLCSSCGQADIFVEVRRLENENDGAFRERRAALEVAVGQSHADQVEVVLTVK